MVKDVVVKVSSEVVMGISIGIVSGIVVYIWDLLEESIIFLIIGKTTAEIAMNVVNNIAIINPFIFFK